MPGIKFIGIIIAVLNIAYSFFYLGVACHDLYTADEDDIKPYLWIAAYICNIVLNAYLLICILVSYPKAIYFWFPPTIILLVFRHLGNMNRSSPLFYFRVFVNFYIMFSFCVMCMIASTLEQNQTAQRTEMYNNLSSTRKVNRSKRILSHRNKFVLPQRHFHSERNDINDDNFLDCSISTSDFNVPNDLNYHESSFSNYPYNSFQDCGNIEYGVVGFGNNVEYDKGAGCDNEGGYIDKGCDSGGGCDTGGGYDSGGGCDSGGGDCEGGTDD